MAPRKATPKPAATPGRKKKDESPVISTRSTRTRSTTTEYAGVTKPTSSRKPKTAAKAAAATSVTPAPKSNIRKAALATPRSSRSRSTVSPAKRAHFDNQVYAQHIGKPATIIEDLEPTVKKTPKGRTQLPTPNPTATPGTSVSPEKRAQSITSIASTRPMVEEPEVPPELNYVPSPPSRRPGIPRDRKVGKVDPAAGPDYTILDANNRVIGDMREQMDYLDTYYNIQHKMGQLQKAILTFADTFCGWQNPVDLHADFLRSLASESTNQELFRYAGYVAAGGPAGIAGWEEVFINPELRKALVAGILWLVLKQHVFNAQFFGIDKANLRKLELAEEGLLSVEDGFMRKHERVTKHLLPILMNLHRRSSNMTKRMITQDLSFPANLAKEHLAAAVTQLLSPFLERDEPPHSYRVKLSKIISSAVSLHHLMAMDPDVIYSFGLTTKDTPFDSRETRISSQAHWDWLHHEDNHPEETKANPEQGLTDEKLKRVQNYPLLSRIVVFEPLFAYRKGGWRKENGDAGYRKMFIIKGAVACRWGATRKFGPKANIAEGDFQDLRSIAKELGGPVSKRDREQWWTQQPADPAWAAKNLPILGKKGDGGQPDLTEFQPRWRSTH